MSPPQPNKKTQGSCWEAAGSKDDLQQGEVVQRCPVNKTQGVARVVETNQNTILVKAGVIRAIIVTQDCDMVLHEGACKAEVITVCRLYKMGEILKLWDKKAKRQLTDSAGASRINEVLKRKHYRYLALESHDGAEPAGLIVDLYDVYTVPLGAIHGSRRQRKRLVSPFKDDLGRVFGNIYSRVSLPGNPPKITPEEIRKARESTP